MRKRLLRYLSALIVSLICTYSGLQRVAFADEAPVRTCGLSDVSVWQMQLADPQEEASPDYVQRVTEDFIAACPNRPEIPEAHRIAARAAAWDDKPEDAARHFEQAGYIADVDSLFIYASVELALGEQAHAWQLRDEAIEIWLARLARRGVADVSIEEAKGGELISVRLQAGDPRQPRSHIWIARPSGAGWPSALTVSADRQLNALHKLRAGEHADDLAFVRLYRCRARRMLARTTEPLSDTQIAAGARLALSAYLADPDIPSSGEIESCAFVERILPDLSAASAFATQ
ncbi:MAG: hypothetical protein WA989_06945 [Henriciella sp.]|uniref:hypothetical protein n=1 Tax=Henriciella sp. TaxID=1968823 RepID=UPI003C74B0DD